MLLQAASIVLKNEIIEVYAHLLFMFSCYLRCVTWLPLCSWNIAMLYKHLHADEIK